MEDILKAKNALLEAALAAVTLPIATTKLECLAESDDHNIGVFFDLVNTSSSYVQIESIVATKHCTEDVATKLLACSNGKSSQNEHSNAWEEVWNGNLQGAESNPNTLTLSKFIVMAPGQEMGFHLFSEGDSRSIACTASHDAESAAKDANLTILPWYQSNSEGPLTDGPTYSPTGCVNYKVLNPSISAATASNLTQAVPPPPPPSIPSSSSPPSGGKLGLNLKFTSPLSGVTYKWVSDLSQWEAIDGDEAEKEAQRLADSIERAKEIANVEPQDKFPSEDEATKLDETVFWLDPAREEAQEAALKAALQTAESNSAVLESCLTKEDGLPVGKNGGTITAVVVGNEDNEIQTVKISARPEPEGMFDPASYGPHKIWIKAGGVSILDRMVNFTPADDVLPAKRYQFYNATTSEIIGSVDLELILPDGSTKLLSQHGDNAVEFPTDITVTGPVFIKPKKQGFKEYKPDKVLWLGAESGVHFKQDYEEKKIFMSQPLVEDEFRIILRWGVNPDDLDLHVWSSDENHCSYDNKEAGSMRLDTDVRGGQGPETMTIKLTKDVRYIVAVHHYGGTGTLMSSEAKLQLLGKDVDEIMTVPRLHSCNEQPKYWKAFGIDEEGNLQRFGSTSAKMGTLVVEESIAQDYNNFN